MLRLGSPCTGNAIHQAPTGPPDGKWIAFTTRIGAVQIGVFDVAAARPTHHDRGGQDPAGRGIRVHLVYSTTAPHLLDTFRSIAADRTAVSGRRNRPFTLTEIETIPISPQRINHRLTPLTLRSS